jgi:hypothetical protein
MSKKRRVVDTASSSSSAAASGRPTKKKSHLELPAFLERDAQQLYNGLWGYASHTSHFIASTPVSLERRHLTDISSQSHVVGEKNDGERKLLLVGAPENNEELPYIAFVNRARKISLVARCSEEGISAKTQFPNKTHTVDLCDGTLLDGELMPSGTFIVFDCVVAGGYDTKKMPFQDRLRVASSCTKALGEYLPCEIKRFYPLEQATNVLENPTGPCDGLILMPQEDPVQTGRHDNCFKWKPAHKCTVDLVHSEGLFYVIGEGGKWIDANMDVEGVRLVAPKVVAPLVSNMIYEVAPSPEGGSRPWVVMGPRPDKMAPNYVTTVRRTLLTIRDNILPEELLQNI